MIPFLFIGTTELLIIGLIVLLLFGGSRIPSLMRSLGSGVKSFKDGMKEGETPESESKANDKTEEVKKD
ncbi:MAG: twin-arginine translocase TatA/TatE family subunit [Bacteroidales bacterium]|nr:twin-arginine translocase TatA/TatE family subunit [Bacteroidales bacterium]